MGKSNNFVRGKICHVKITNLSLNEHIGCRKRSLQTKALQYESLRNDPFCRKWISSNPFRSEFLLTRISTDFKNPCRLQFLLDKNPFWLLNSHLKGFVLKGSYLKGYFLTANTDIITVCIIQVGEVFWGQMSATWN